MVLFLGGGGDPGSWEAVSKEGSCFCGGLTFWGGSASKGGRLYGCPPHLRGSREVAWSAGALRASVSPLYFGEPHIVSPLSPHFRCRRGGGQPHRGYMEPLNPPPPPHISTTARGVAMGSSPTPDPKRGSAPPPQWRGDSGARGRACVPPGCAHSAHSPHAHTPPPRPAQPHSHTPRFHTLPHHTHTHT